jgi:outer membrane receptor protein involved in Fe transport
LKLILSNSKKAKLKILALSLVALSTYSGRYAIADDEKTALPEVLIEDTEARFVGGAESASEGVVTDKDIATRPLARTGEVMETIPGMITTQHSGGGKANQFYLRGFDLDHGNDFATYLDGVPINLPTHAHGQGYTDTNWIIPELIQNIDFFKGSYYAQFGDFANAGAAEISYRTELPYDLVKFEAGGFGYLRGLAMTSSALGTGHLLSAIEVAKDDGAWDVPENYRKFNGVFKWSKGDERNGYSLSAQGYSGIWNATDQVPNRAIQSGMIGRFGSLDTSSGGLTDRVSGNAEWHTSDDSSQTQIRAYIVRYDLNLFSDFTYFLDQTNGDQIQQEDARNQYGVIASQTLFGKILGFENQTDYGLQGRFDDTELDLNQTVQRQLRNVVRSDHVHQLNVAPWIQGKTHWNSWLSSLLGARFDLFNFQSHSADVPANSGDQTATVISPKISLIFGPWAHTEYYVQGGIGFRTNDARGIVSTLKPDNLGPSPGLSAIVRTQGAEVGVRTHMYSAFDSALALWMINTDSEAFFEGDSGSVEDSGRPGHRVGVEWTNVIAISSLLTADAEVALSHAKFTDNQAVGNHIPEAVSQMISAGIVLQNPNAASGFFASLRVRYFGARDLIEDASQKSAPSTVLNALTGYAISKNFVATLEALNLTNAQYNDAEYYYSARLRNEVAGSAAGGGTLDHMVHAGQPLNLRAGIKAYF